MSQILFNDSYGSPDGYVQMCARDDDIEISASILCSSGSTRRPWPEWSANKPTMVSLIGQESDDHVLNERLVNNTTYMAYFIGLTSNDKGVIFIT